MATTSSTALRSRSRSEALPRLHVAQPYDDNLADSVCEVARAAGIDLLPWQVDILRDWSAIDADGQWVHPRDGACVPRQAGKSVAGIAWVTTLTSVMGYKVLWTDHNYSTTCEMLSRFRDIFGSKAHDPAAKHKAFNKRVKLVNNKTAQEAYEFKNGGVLAFSTRTKSAALGYSFDVVVFDEAQELTGEQAQAIVPTMTSGAKGNPQVIYLGTPTRAGSSAESFQEIREDAWAGGERASDLCWIEYGVDEIGDVTDESRWLEVNPSLGYLANYTAIRMGMRSGMGELGFAQEYLGYWLPKVADAILSRDEWDACLVEKEQSPESGRIAYGVKFSPDGLTVALAAAIRPGAGPVHVEVVEAASTSKGTAWLVEWIAGRPGIGSCVAIDGASGAGALCEDLAQVTPKLPRNYVVPVRTGDAISAASMMLDAIRGGHMTHISQPALDTSALRATRRKIGSSGGWGWGGDDSAPIEAAALALWAVRTTKRDPKRKSRVHV